jgi:hypothetical protein
MQNRFIKWASIALLIIGSTGWVLLFRSFYDGFMTDFMQPFTGIRDISCRLKSPDGQKVGLLVRNSGFDLNCRLYIFDNYFIQPPYDSYDSLWLSDDYNPDDQGINLHEDLEWSKDSFVIAVIIDRAYVFAYDFDTQKEYKDEGEIKQLLESRDLP